MTWLALAIALGAAPPPPAPAPWRVVATEDVHVGVRPAALVSTDELGIGVTVQVTARVLSF